MLLKSKAYRISIITYVLLFSLSCASAFAFEDGFGVSKRITSQHFTIYLSGQLDSSDLALQLNISASDILLAGKHIKKDDSSDVELADTLDTLFLRVCGILDMQLYSFQGNIKVCKDASQLNKIYNNLFAKDLGRESFYVYDLNTIYISKESFTREILGHEIAHAVISHYFVVLPSVRIQEVLAGYVEYQLRKLNR